MRDQMFIGLVLAFVPFANVHKNWLYLTRVSHIIFSVVPCYGAEVLPAHVARVEAYFQRNVVANLRTLL